MHNNGVPVDLSAAVDVYSDWVDACDAVAKDTADKYEGGDSRGAQVRRSPDQIADSRDYDEDDY